MPLRIDYRKRPNARRYILRVNARGDGGCVTIPRGGCREEARNFARRNTAWLEERLRKWQAKVQVPVDETRILFRGEMVSLAESTAAQMELGEGMLIVTPGAGSLRARAKAKLWALARVELPLRVSELAVAHGLAVKRVSVRNQRSRWGSCSARGVVSLNWRLMQAPEVVRDYIIVHELMHLREMNHSERYWKLVYAAFPRTEEAERWLKAHGTLLRD